MAANRINHEVIKLVNNTITKSNDLNVMADQITQLLVAALGIKGATIYVLNARRDELEILSTCGLSVEYMNKGPILVDRSIKLAPNRKPVIVADVSQSNALQYPERAKSEGVNAIVSLPVLVREAVIGAVRLYHSQQWDISTEDLEHLEVICGSLGMALMYYRLATAVEAIKETVNDIHNIWL